MSPRLKDASCDVCMHQFILIGLSFIKFRYNFGLVLFLCGLIPRSRPRFTMGKTPGFMSDDITPDIVLISNEDDIRLYVILTYNKVIIISYKLQQN